MDEDIDRNRRRFLATGAMTIAAAHLGILSAVKASAARRVTWRQSATRPNG